MEAELREVNRLTENFEYEVAEASQEEDFQLLESQVSYMYMYTMLAIVQVVQQLNGAQCPSQHVIYMYLYVYDFMCR